MLHGPKCEMSKSREKRAAAIQDGIRQILYRDWDPIGVWGTAPQDEYDSYIGGVYRRLATSRSEEALVQFLAGAFEDLSGLKCRRQSVWRAVAQELLALDGRL